MTITMPDAGRGFRKELAAAASLFHGLADPTRLAIVRRLSVGEARIVDLTEQFGLAQQRAQDGEDGFGPSRGFSAQVRSHDQRCDKSQ